jgi:hypothetical protein
MFLMFIHWLAIYQGPTRGSLVFYYGDLDITFYELRHTKVLPSITYPLSLVGSVRFARGTCVFWFRELGLG